MITIIFSTREPNPRHIEHIKKSSGLHNKIEVLEFINNNDSKSKYFNGGDSLTKIYNRGLNQAKNDIVVFCHDDLTIETKQWGNKLLKQFQKNPEYGIIGVAGSKNMPESGKWWENPKKMYGRVQHTHEGKTWLSAYSDDLGQELESVVSVDGVWFAIDKTKIKTNFNEKVQGFHFYDVTFCFENYLKGVKIGVTTLIRVNHQSIGQTNDSWEANRVEFAHTFKNELPANVKRVVRKGEKLKVLIGCLNFREYTGSELYVFELAKKLIKEGYDVSVCSNIGHPLIYAAHRLGIKMYSLQEPPGFKLGDDKWLLKTSNNESVVSKENTIYKVNDVKFDVIHLNHKPVTEHLLRYYPDTPVVCSIHSEVISLEEPVLSPQIKQYVAIRPEIKNYIVNKFSVPEELVKVIYNPIDGDRFKRSFKPQPIRTEKRILFVGTIDYLRKQTIQDLINTTKENHEELWIVGKKNDTYLDDIINGQFHVKYFNPSANVEEYIHQCDETAGILLGRTTIEGWLCGKKGWVYDVDEQGNILSKQLMDIPDDIEKFKLDNVIKEIKHVYESVIE